VDRKYNCLCIVMEYCNSGDLYQQIVTHQKNNKLFDENEVWKVLIQTIKGL